MMTPTLQFQRIDVSNNDHLQAVTMLWNRACGAELAISPRFAAYNLRPSVGGDQAAWLALSNNRPIGFISASYMNDPTVSQPHSGWIDAIAVTPDEQGKGIGRALLQQAEAWHAQKGSQFLTVGASPRPFLPGVPEELNTVGFFQHHGYGTTPKLVDKQWDVAADLSHYRSPATVREIDGLVRPAHIDDYDALLAFLLREFPTVWRYDFERYIAEGGRVSDYMVLWTERGVDGCCILTFEDSLHPIERFYPYQLPRPWGQLGSIGVSEDRRGLGYGAALLDAGLRRLHNNGVNGCVIDWTDLLDFYAKFGFTPYRTYLILYRPLCHFFFPIYCAFRPPEIRRPYLFMTMHVFSC
jgi:GNAT superfamily N-acetyltransferase